MNYIDSVNGRFGDYVLNSFSNLLMADGETTDAKTVTFPNGYEVNSNMTFRVMFPNGHNGQSNMTLNGYPIVVNKYGTLIPLPYHEISSTYKSLQNYTVLEMYYTSDYDGNGTEAFVIVGNPVVLESDAYVIYANGLTKVRDSDKVVASADKLTTARTTYVTLDTSSTSQTRDWSGTTTIPVNGILGVSNGGTGTNSLSSVCVGRSGYADSTGSASYADSANNSNNLSNIGVRSTTTTDSEVTNYWSYVTKSRFSSDGGYIVYSNGLIIQWISNLYGGDDQGNYQVNLPLSFSNNNYFVTASGSYNNLSTSTETSNADERVDIYYKRSNYIMTHNKFTNADDEYTDFYLYLLAIGY